MSKTTVGLCSHYCQFRPLAVLLSIDCQWITVAAAPNPVMMYSHTSNRLCYKVLPPRTGSFRLISRRLYIRRQVQVPAATTSTPSRLSTCGTTIWFRLPPAWLPLRLPRRPSSACSARVVFRLLVLILLSALVLSLVTCIPSLVVMVLTSA